MVVHLRLRYDLETKKKKPELRWSDIFVGEIKGEVGRWIIERGRLCRTGRNKGGWMTDKY